MFYVNHDVLKLVTSVSSRSVEKSVNYEGNNVYFSVFSYLKKNNIWVYDVKKSFICIQSSGYFHISQFYHILFFLRSQHP